MKWTEMTVIVPNDLSEPLKVLYLLHGDSQDHTTYTRETALEQLAYKYNIMAVCLNGDKSYWTNMAKALGNYEDHVIESVNYIDKLFPTSKDRKDRFIQGLSMGGYETSIITLRRPEVFGYYGLLSGGSYSVEDIKDPKQVRGIFVGCGSKENGDAVIREAEALNAAGIKAKSYVSPGTAHEFLTWRRCLREMAPMLFK